MEPSLILQTVIRDTLLASQAVTDLVQPDHIREGSTRPDNFPTIILADPQTINLGRDDAGQYLTRCYLDIHIWAMQGGANLARQIGAMVTAALWDAPAGLTFTNDHDAYVRPSFRYLRDPDPDRAYTHGVATVEAVIGWRP